MACGAGHRESRRDLSQAQLLHEVREADAAVQTALAGLNDAALKRPPPASFPGAPEGADAAYFLLSLSAHLNWHLGQINYHCRLLSPRA